MGKISADRDKEEARVEVMRLIQGVTDPAIQGSCAETALFELVSNLLGIDVQAASEAHAIEAYCAGSDAIGSTIWSLTERDDLRMPPSSRQEKDAVCREIVHLVQDITNPAALGLYAEDALFELIGNILDVDIMVATEEQATEVYNAGCDAIGSAMRRLTYRG